MGEVNCPGPPHFLSLMHGEGLPTRLGAGSGDLPSPPIPPNPERAATSHKAFPVPKEQGGSRRKGRGCSDKGGQELHRRGLGQLMPAEHPLEGLAQEVPEFGCCTREGLASGRLKSPVQAPAQSRAVVYLQAMLRQGGISKGRQPPQCPRTVPPSWAGSFSFS